MVQLGSNNKDKDLLEPLVVFFVIVRLIAGVIVGIICRSFDDLEWCNSKEDAGCINSMCRWLMNLFFVFLRSYVAVIMFKIREIISDWTQDSSTEHSLRQSLWWVVCLVVWGSVFPTSVISFVAVSRGYNGSGVTNSVAALIDTIATSIAFVLVEVMRRYGVPNAVITAVEDAGTVQLPGVPVPVPAPAPVPTIANTAENFIV